MSFLSSSLSGKNTKIEQLVGLKGYGGENVFFEDLVFVVKWEVVF